MTKEEIKEYLKENLSIEVDTKYRDFMGNGSYEIKTLLKLEGEIISESYDTISI